MDPKLLKILIKVQRIWKAKVKVMNEQYLQRRNEIVKEIFFTEQVYVNQLNILISLYVNPIRALGEDIISRNITKRMFSDIEIIRNYNALMLESLQKRVVEPLTGQEILGDIFLGMVSDE